MACGRLYARWQKYHLAALQRAVEVAEHVGGALDADRDAACRQTWLATHSRGALTSSEIEPDPAPVAVSISLRAIGALSTSLAALTIAPLLTTCRMAIWANRIKNLFRRQSFNCDGQLAVCRRRRATLRKLLAGEDCEARMKWLPGSRWGGGIGQRKKHWGAEGQPYHHSHLNLVAARENGRRDGSSRRQPEH